MSTTWCNNILQRVVDWAVRLQRPAIVGYALLHRIVYGHDWSRTCPKHMTSRTTH